MRLVLAGLAVGLLLAGCLAPAVPQPTDAPEASAPKSGAPEPRTWDVVMQGKRFINDTVTIYAGDTVRWTHLDGAVGHSVMADDMAFSSNNECMADLLPHPLCMTNGDTFEVTLDEPGTVTYHCHAHHDTMKATIEVVPRPA
jgi:plastocyanin